MPKQSGNNEGWLVLTRSLDESIFIGDSEVRVVEIKHGRVRLAVRADRSVPIDRGEIRERKNRSAVV